MTRKIGKKLALSPIRDGHAPLLSGKDLNAYVLAGLQSDHECTTLSEAKEKLDRGMCLFIREGTTEQNIATLVPVVKIRQLSPAVLLPPMTVTQTCSWKAGISTAASGKPSSAASRRNSAIRMATLSPAIRFGLSDRGARSAAGRFLRNR